MTRRPPVSLLLLAALVGAAFLVLSASRLSTPPLDSHAWRQSLGLLAGRALVCGAPLMQPTVDACPGEGVTGMELPAYAYAGALLGRISTPWVGPRLVAFLGALAAIFGLALLVFAILSPRWPEEAAVIGAAGAAAVLLYGPLARHWMGSLVPDGLAVGVALLGAGLALLAGHRRPGVLVAASLLMGLGVATKLLALPLLATSTALLLLAPGEARRRLASALLHGAFVLLPVGLWYVLWNPGLVEAGGCELFLLERQRGLLAAFTSPEVRETLPRHLRALAGPLWPLAAAGGALFLVVGRLRALAVFLSALVTAWLLGTLGWHPLAHEYDGLGYLLAVGAGAGTGLGALGWLLLLPARRGRRWVLAGLPVAALVVWAVGEADLGRRGELHHRAWLMHGADVARVVPRSEAVYLRDRYDPRLAYFGSRRTTGVETFQAPCNGASPPVHDCVVWPHGPPAPDRCGRGLDAAQVHFPELTIHCGLRMGDAPARVRRSLRASTAAPFDPPLPWPGLGRLLAADLRFVDGGRLVDLYVELGAPPGLPGQVPISLDGRPTHLGLHSGLRRTPAGSIAVLRAKLAEGPGQVRLGVPGVLEALELRADRPAEPLAWRCAGE